MASRVEPREPCSLASQQSNRPTGGGGKYRVNGAAMEAASVYRGRAEDSERCTHKSRVGLPYRSKYTSPLKSTPMDDLVVLYAVEFDTQGLNAFGV